MTREDYEAQVEAMLQQAAAGGAKGSQGTSPSAIEKVLKQSASPKPPTPPPEPSSPARPPSPPPARKPTPDLSEPLGTFSPGTVLQLEDGTLAIYKEPVKGKEYEIVYVLRPTGKAAPEGIALYAYEAKKLGLLAPEYLEQLQRTLRWDRDVIVFHLDKLEYRDLVPVPAETTGPRPDPPTAALLQSGAGRELARGRRIRISFGPGKSWEAVYWGKDLLGHVLAHRTHNQWALMHLDLKRFRDSIELGEFLSPDEIEAIQNEILHPKDQPGG
jgi:hypothetical protein